MINVNNAELQKKNIKVDDYVLHVGIKKEVRHQNIKR
jgi:hypothetical protein